jgi:DNA-directed RNA polymerase subunit RPC12/RpoP
VGRIEKYPLDRMKSKDIKLSFECPQCIGSRIEMNDREDMGSLNGVKCPKCSSLILVDDLSVTVVKEDGGARKGGH